MTRSIVVIPGPCQVELSGLHSVAGEFGWVVEVAQDLGEAVTAQPSGKAVAVLFYRDGLGPGCGWLEATRLLRLALPKARLVVCHEFSDPIDWVKLSDAGVFHALQLPLKENEVRQSLGFVWQAEKRLAGTRLFAVA